MKWIFFLCQNTRKDATEQHKKCFFDKLSFFYCVKKVMNSIQKCFLRCRTLCLKARKSVPYFVQSIDRKKRSNINTVDNFCTNTVVRKGGTLSNEYIIMFVCVLNVDLTQYGKRSGLQLFFFWTQKKGVELFQNKTKDLKRTPADKISHPSRYSKHRESVTTFVCYKSFY